MNFYTNSIRIIIYSFICALFFTHTSTLFSQIEDENVTYKGWIDYNAIYHVSKKLKVYGDVGFRKISPNYWTRYYIRPAARIVTSVGKRPGKYVTITYNFGVGTFFTNSVDTSNLIELRPFQGVDIQWPNFRWLSINHYVRLEEQFFSFNNNWDFDLRLRYMLAGEFHWLNKNRDKLNNIYIPVQIELFWNMLDSDQLDNQIRFISGAGYTF